MWWAGKELLPGKLLRDYAGKNEKTKIVNFPSKHMLKCGIVRLLNYKRKGPVLL